MTTEDFDFFREAIGKLTYLANSHMSSIGNPIPGNDPKKPN
jgi:hypothetical protein